MRTALQSCFDSFVQEQNATPPTAELHLRRPHARCDRFRVAGLTRAIWQYHRTARDALGTKHAMCRIALLELAPTLERATHLRRTATHPATH